MRNKRAKQLRRYASYFSEIVMKGDTKHKTREIYHNMKIMWNRLPSPERHRASNQIKVLCG